MEKLYRMIYPMRTCLITSRHEGRDNVMTASWVMPVSFDPILFGVAVGEARYSHGLIKQGGAFAINLPHPGLQEAAVICGTVSGRDKDKFAEAGLTKEPGILVPLIKECPASIECEVVDRFRAGDHTIFVGKIVGVKRRFEGKGLFQDREGNFLGL